MNSVKNGLKHLLSTTLVVLITAIGLVHPSAAQTLVANRYDKMSDSTASAVATHEMGLTMLDTTTPIGSIVFEFCSNDPLPNEPCTAPNGMDASGVSLTAQTGDIGFLVHPNTNTNRIVLSRVPIPPTGVASTYTLENIINPSDLGTHFIRIYTYNSIDGTGGDIENGGIAISIAEAVQIGSEVDPHLTFCVGVTITAFDCSTANSFFIDLGFLDTAQPRYASSQFLVQTNAIDGYTVTVSGTTLTSGINTIASMPVPAPSNPGTSQFGMNLRQNAVPPVGTDPVGAGDATPQPNYDIPDQFVYNDGDIIASVDHSDYDRKFTASYITNISPAQTGGVYSTTISFICLGNF
jgi:hypothetical protein